MKKSKLSKLWENKLLDWKEGYAKGYLDGMRDLNETLTKIWHEKRKEVRRKK